MEYLTPEKIAHANALGETIRKGFAEVLEEQGITGRVTGLGSFVGFHLTAEPVTDYKSVSSVRPALRDSVHLGLVNHGVLTSRGGVLNTSTVMTDEDAGKIIEAFQNVLVELKPAIEAECPDLLA